MNDHQSATAELGEAEMIETTLDVNGVEYPLALAASTSLLTAVRDHIGLTGTKEGCDDSECGACMVLVDNRPVNSCSYLALQAGGRSITTVEGLGPTVLSDLQNQLLAAGGIQCGFCTPGMLMSATALLASTPQPTLEEVRIALSGNLCRCTGYVTIIDAVMETAVRLGDGA